MGRAEMPTQEVLEGTWEQILTQGSRLAGKRVRLTVLPGEESAGPILKRGLFPQLQVLTDEDFKAAEFRGDAEDGLD
jgi:hypothetical protein